MTRKYTKSTRIIFNECETGPSIMDEKNRRNKNSGSEISFIGATPLKTKKQVFLSNAKNRNEFIKLLSRRLGQTGFTVSTTTNDANIVIAQEATVMSTKKMTVAVGEEAALLVLMCFYAKNESQGLYLRCCKKAKSTKTSRLWNITETKRLIGDKKCNWLLFVNAFGGCQSTSHIFGIGETLFLNKLDDQVFTGRNFC